MGARLGADVDAAVVDEERSPPEEPQPPPRTASSPTAIAAAAPLAGICLSRPVIVFSLAWIDIPSPLLEVADEKKLSGPGRPLSASSHLERDDGGRASAA